MLLLVDNSGMGPSTYIRKLRAVLKKMGVPIVEVTSNTVGQLDDATVGRIKGIILSGSPMCLTSTDVSLTDYAANIHYITKRELMTVPVLGICFGAQLLHVVMGGGSLAHQAEFFCRLGTVCTRPRHPLFMGVADKRMKFCFSDLAVRSLASCHDDAHEIAWFRYSDGATYPCAFEYEGGRVYGCLFHPEARKASHRIIANFVNMCVGR